MRFHPIPLAVSLVALAAVSSGAQAAVRGLTTDAAMRKGIRDTARIEGHGATASRIDVSCGPRGKIGHRAHCTGSFRLTRHGRSATYRLGAKATVSNNSPGSLMYRVNARADRKVKGLPSRTDLAGFLQ